jgi:hypothetical protein
MIHATEGALQALADDELPVADRLRLERHLEECPACTTELHALRAASAELSSAVQTVDRPAPVDAAYREFVRRRASGGRWGPEVRRSLQRAAILVLAVAGVASATIPGSPIRQWVGELLEPSTSESARAIAIQPEVAPTAAAAAETSATGVSVLPANGRVTVALESPVPELEVRVRLSDREFAEVQVTGAAAAARFRTSPGRIEVAGAEAGEIRIGLPRSARNAAVQINGKLFVYKEGDQLRLLTPAADSAGAEIVFRAGT